MLNFRPITIEDKTLITSIVKESECRNCDLNFVNLMSWRFLYHTEIATHDDWLLFRFKADGHTAYLAPIGHGDWASIVGKLLDDAKQQDDAFLMLGVVQTSLQYLNDAMPDYFYANADSTYTDYLYLREKLATLSGKKLQPKRNLCNRFQKLYPNYEFLPLTDALIPECLSLRTQWEQAKEGHATGRLSAESERKSIEFVFDNWHKLPVRGGVLKVDGKVVAFTYGGAVNYDTFDICVEKADTHYEGAFSMINREFARSLPEEFVYINREEDLGVEGLRRAKESYYPELLLHKFTVMEKRPLGRDF